MIIKYYELKNTINEWSSKISGRYTTLDFAKEDMKNHCDWYCKNGTGRIYEVVIKESKKNKGKIIISRKLVYEA